MAALHGSHQRNGKVQGWTKTPRSSRWARVRDLRDRALGKGQVLKKHIQATVLLVEELLHPPVGRGLPEFQPGRRSCPEWVPRAGKGPGCTPLREDTKQPLSWTQLCLGLLGAQAGRRAQPSPPGVGRRGGRAAVLDTLPPEVAHRHHRCRRGCWAGDQQGKPQGLPGGRTLLGPPE